MPLTDPIGEPLIEEQESLIPEFSSTKHSLLPGIKTNKHLLYPISGEPENSKPLNLIEPALEPKDEFSRAETDAFILNKASDINSIPSGISTIQTNKKLGNTTTSEVDPLIGKLDSDLGDPLINPNRIGSNNAPDDSNKLATSTPRINSSTSTSELNKTTEARTAIPDKLRENQTLLATESTTSEKASDQTLLAATESTTSEKAFSKTPLAATAETSSKPEERKTPLSLSSGAILKNESESNKVSPATASTTDKSEPNKTLTVTTSTSAQSSANKTSPAIVSTTDKLEANKTSPATASTTDKSEPNKTSPTTSTPDNSEANKVLPATVSISDKIEANTTLSATVSTTDKSEYSTTSPAITSTNDNSKVNTTSSATASTIDNKYEPDQTSPTTLLNTESSEANQQLPTITSNTDKSEPNKTSPTITSNTDKLESNTTSPTITSNTDKLESNKTSPTATATANNLDTATNLESNKTSTPATSINFDSNAFLVDKKGIVGIEFTSDGGWYTGQLAIVSLLGMEKFVPGSESFVSEAARRALSNSTSGYIAISDDLESAYYTDANSSENFNSGQYLGTKTFAMTPGDKFFFMLVPNGTVQQVYDNPAIGGDKKPLFSIATDNPNDGFSIGQIADITGEGKLFVMEDMGLMQGSERDYNDIIFKITGATSKVAPLSQFIDKERQKSYSQFVQKLINFAPIESPKNDSIIAESNSKLPPKADSKIAESEITKTPKLELTTTVERNQPKTEPTVDNQESKSPKTESPTTVGAGKSDPEPIVDNSPTSELPPTTAIVDTSVSPNISSNDSTSTNQKSPTVSVDEATNPETLSKTAVASDKIEFDKLSLIVTIDKQINPEIPAKTAVIPEKLASEQSSQNPATVPTSNSNSELDVTAQPLTVPTNASLKIDRVQIKPAVATPTMTASETTAFPTIAAVENTEVPTTTAAENTEVPTTTAATTAVGTGYDSATIKVDSNLVEQLPQPRELLVDNLSEQLPNSNTGLPAANAAEQLPSAIDSHDATSVVDTFKDSAVTEIAEFKTDRDSLFTPPVSATPSNSLLLLKPTDGASDLLPLLTEEPTQIVDSEADNQSANAQSTANLRLNSNPSTFLSIAASANSQTPGTFTVGTTGKVRFDYVFDGGYFEGELGIFSLAGMEAFTPGTPEFIAEASRRVLSNSTDGHIVISDSTESAKFTGAMPFDGDWGSGEYQGIKTFNMTPGDTFAVMLVPNATIQSSLQSSYSGNWFPEYRPLFSIATANPNDTSYVLPLADATGTGNTFAMEDMSAANSDGDYNDLIFTVLGATGNAPLLDAVINPDREWRNTPLGQQLIEYANSQVPSETAPPAIVAALVNDTGSNSTDGITNNPAISGTITDASDIASFRASFSRESIGIELKDLLTSDGSFALTPNALSTVNGNTLTDGTYTLYLVAADSHGNTNTFELPFTLDTTPPELTFGLNLAFDTPPIGDGQTLDSTVTLTGQTDPGSTVILAETKAITTADSTGRFEFAGVTLAIGSNSFTATATDFAGNSSTASRTFTRIAATDSGIIWLAEETSFTKKLERPMTIPAVPSTLSVNITGLNFDTTDLDSINDAFEIALVDASGRSLVHTVGTGLNSFFNFTEGQPPQLAPGVTFNGSNISVNLSQIAPGTAATLQVRLVNNDSDTATQVGITSIAIQPSSAATASVTALPSQGVSTNAPVNFNRLQDVGGSLEAEYKQTSFNSSSKILYADLAVKNAGQYPVRGTVLVGINKISDPTVRLLDADGITPEGIPYYDISKLVIGGILKPGELTSTDTLKFYNPQGVQFSYDLVFLSQLNQVPQFKAAPDTEALVGKGYVYTAIAVDADGDALTYSLLEKPQGMEIDSVSGIISWNPVAGDIGNHAVTVQVVDGKGGVAKQKYALSAINPPPNRPPIFTSTPVVDAAVNTPYRYDADAKDPDSDTLTYNLVLGPEGMRINPETGIVQWTPPSAMVFGDTVLGRIGSLGEQDTYTFSALEGQRIYYDSLRITPGQTLKLYSPSGLLVLDSNTGYQGPPINLTETGNYRLVIDGAAGDYGFSLIDMEQTPIAPFDRNVTGLLSPGTEDDAYRFNGFKGQRLYFDQLSGNSTNGNWILYDGEGRQVSSWIDGKQVGPWYVGWQDNEIVLPSDSEYTLVLRGSAPFFGSTSYTFRIVTPDAITYPLQLGSNANPNTVSAAITEKGEQDIYTFGGTKGQRLYFDYLSSSNQVNASVKLVSPSGVEAFNINLGSDTEPFTINETGTYRLEIDGQWESTGNYSFNLLDVGNATPINKNTDVTGQLSPGLETHFYSFTGDASQRLYLDSDINPGWANWTLYGPGNQAIATDSKTTFGGPNTYAGNNPSGFGGDFEVVLPSAGNYLLAVQGRNATPVDYKFRVNTPQTQSGGTLTPDTWGNLSVSGSISQKGERDVYTFSGSANQRLLLDALVETPNTYVRLISPSGIEVFNTPAFWDGGRTIPYILPEAGNYRLIVDGNIESTENYNFRLVSLTTAPTLNLNVPTSGTLSPGSETDVYQFTGTAGDRLYLDTLLSSSFSDWLLYGPGNQLLSFNSLSSDIETVLPGSGTYYIVLRGNGTPVPGGNGIATPINYSIQPFFSTASPTPLTLGSVNNASISKPGEQDVYTFTGSVGQRMYFDPRSGNGNITAKIISPSGLEIFSGNTSADGLSNTLTESGTYRLTIDGNNDVLGSYSFRLADATAAPILPLGTATPGSLPPNEAVLYQISGTAGGRIQFDSLSPAASGASWALHAPGFPNFWSQIGGSSLSSDFEVLLPVTGAYTLVLQNISSSNVSYSISANNITSPPVAKSGLGITRSGTVLPTTPVNQTFTASAGTYPLNISGKQLFRHP